MLSFKQFTESNKVYSQIEKPTSQGKELGIVSSERGEYQGKAKKSRNTSLKTDLKRLAAKRAITAYHTVKGQYQYTDPKPGESGGAKEKSFVVRQGEGSKGKHFDHIMKALGNRYGQESIMRIHKDKSAEWQHLKTSGTPGQVDNKGKVTYNKPLTTGGGNSSFRKNQSFTTTNEENESGAAKPSFAEHLKNLPSTVKDKYNNLKNNSKKAVADWHEKSPQEKVQHVGNAVADFAKTAGHNIKHVGKEEIQMYHGAGKAISHLAKGNSWSSLPDAHKTHLKKSLIHAGLTAADIGLTGGLHSAHGAMAATLGVGAHHLHHSALIASGEAAVKTGHHYIKKATTMDEATDNENRLEKITRLLTQANIPTSVWIEIQHEIEQKIKQSKVKRPLHDFKKKYKE